MTPGPAYDLNRVRRAFPIAEELTFLNHASISPIPLPTRQVMEVATDVLIHEPGAVYRQDPDDPENDLFERFSTACAQLINAADLTEVVGVPSTSTGISIVAQAINWQPGDNVVICDAEFPSNVYPWMVLARRGVECRFAPAVDGGASLAAFTPLVDARTRVIAVSAVQFLSGHRTDLAAFGGFCRERGILFLVDAIQAAGHMPIDVQAMYIDALAAGGQKSLMGPPGQGFLYVREDVCNTLQATMVGPNAVEGWLHWLKYDLTPRQAAWRFMLGTVNTVGMNALVESIRFLRDLGLSNIDQWTRHLSHVAIDDLSSRGYTVVTPIDPAHLGPIVTFRVGDRDDKERAEVEATAMHEYLTASGIRLTKHWDADRWPHLRISTHCYNTEAEVRRVGAVLEEFTNE